MESNTNKVENKNTENISNDNTVEESIDVNTSEPIKEEKIPNQKNTNDKSKKNKKNKQENNNLTKQNSQMSANSLKTDKKKQDDKKDPNANKKKQANLVNILAERIRISNQNIPVDEMIDTTVDKAMKQMKMSKNLIKKLNNQIKDQVTDQVEQQKGKIKKVNDKPDKPEKQVKQQFKKPDIIDKKPEITEKKSDKDNIQNKKVEELLKKFKEKKENKGVTKQEEIVYIRAYYLNTFKYLFILDPTQKLKLRDLFTLNSDAINVFFDITKDVFAKFANNSDEEYIKQNIREASNVLDNLCEVSIGTELLSFIVEKGIEFLVYLYDSGIIYRQFTINMLYTIIKYQPECNITNIDQLMSIHKYIHAELSEYLTGKLINFKEDENLNYLLFTKSLLSIILTKMELIIDDQIDELITHIKREDFNDEFNNIKYFTKYYYLFDYHKSKLFNLSMKVSKSIETNLIEIQNNIIKSNQILFLRSINHILFIYLNSFDMYFNESFNDEVFNLMKFIIEDKILYFNEILITDTLDSIELKDISFPTDDQLSKYISMTVKYIKYFEKAFIKRDEKEIDIYLRYFHQVLFKVINIKVNYIKERYEKLIEKAIEPFVNNDIVSAKICDYITDFITNTLLKNQSNILKNVKFAKDIIKFYSNSTQVKMNILNVLNKTEIGDKIVFSIFTVFYLNFFNLNKETDNKILSDLLNSSENLVISLLFLDKKLCSYYMKNYINEELNVTEKIINIVLDNKTTFSIDRLIEHILKSLETSNDVNDIMNTLNVLNRLISKNLITSEMIEKILYDIKSDNFGNKLIYNSLLFYFINRLRKTKDISDMNIFDNKFDIISEIKEINDRVTTYKERNIITGIDDILPYFLQLIKLDEILRKDPNYFSVENIEIETLNEDDQVIQKEKTNQLNLSIVLNILNNYIDYINTGIDDKTMFNISILQETINTLLSNNTIFNSLVKDRTSLELFIKKYINMKENCYEIANKTSKELKHSEDITLIAKCLSINELSDRISVNCANFMKYRCKDKIIYLFKEVDIFKMFLTKDREFLKILYEQLSANYQLTILNTENLSSLLSKVQNEEIDYSDEVIYSIFSKQVISYLECPEELIEFLGTMNDALKYDFNIERKDFYNSLFSYFYLWKAIMAKIENGFKLYTTDKQHVGTIDNYKILLKFIVSYLEKNNRLYEMFLLLSISLIHLIDDEKILDSDRTIMDNIDQLEEDTTSDKFMFHFLLNVFYKFVKIFPTLVKYYYDETKSKLKNTIKYLISHIILPKMLQDLMERLNNNQVYITNIGSSKET
jgi:hypothetical protein